MGAYKKAFILTAIPPPMFEKFFKPADADDVLSAQQEQEREAEKQQALATELAYLEQCTQESQWGQAAQESAFTRVRQAAAEKITDPQILHDLEKHSQDKSVQHIVREKIKLQKQHQAEQAQAQQTIENLCQKIEHLAAASHSPLFKPQYQHLLREWDALQDANHEQAKRMVLARMNNARSACDAVLVQFAEEEKRLDTQRAAEAALLAEQEANKAIWAKVGEEEKAAQEEAVRKKQEEENRRAQHDKEQSLLERSLLEQIAAIENALQQGTLANISKKLKSVQQKLDTLDKSRAQQHEGKVQLLLGRLNELRDWQSYAAMPKKQELCAKMQALIGSTLPAKELSDAIHELQSEWQNLKGGGKEEEQKLWVQFKEAADKAYEPCKKHFEQQRELRAENLRQREKVCAELEQFCQSYSWEQADWKAVDRIVETAKQEFHRFSPVDHKHQKPIKERYDNAVRPLIDKLRDVQKQNESEKQALIDRTRKLMELADIHQAIEQAKTFQQQWKQIGITRPWEDQKLWQQFRSACDAVFSRRSAEREQAQESLKQDLARADELCSAIEALARLDDSALQKSRDQYQQLRQAFQAMEKLHKEKQKKLFARFYQACDRYQEQVAGIKTRQQQSTLQAAFRKAALCEQLESGGAPESIEIQWAAEPALSGEAESVLNKRYANALCIARGEAKTDSAANDKQRRLILIRLEILLDKATPETDKNLRMSYQLSQLSNKGLAGKTNPSDRKANTETLITEWLGTPAGTPGHRDELQQRFERLVK